MNFETLKAIAYLKSNTKDYTGFEDRYDEGFFDAINRVYELLRAETKK